jgi:5-(carboxyamino)imidazole ribonucleotide mutase
MKGVLFILGSKSDFEAIQGGLEILSRAGVPSRVRIASAHRSPLFLEEILYEANADPEVAVILAAAGQAAHLPGVIAAKTIKPVIGIALVGAPFQGVDAMLSIVSMPKGVPCPLSGLGKTGAINGALFSLRLLALQEPSLRSFLLQYQKELEEVVREDDAKKSCP